jgi:hypothetical protein
MCRGLAALLANGPLQIECGTSQMPGKPSI